MPHGTMWPNIERSGSTFSAKPCIVRPRVSRTPMAAILRGCGPSVDPHARIAVEAAGAGQAEVGERVDHELLDRPCT